LFAQGFEENEEEQLDSSESVASDADPSSILDYEGIRRDDWFGKALLAKHADNSNFANVMIITANPNAYINGQSRLGEDDVGIVVLEVLNGDPNVGDMCLCWPMHCLFYHGQIGTFSIYDHA